MDWAMLQDGLRDLVIQAGTLTLGNIAWDGEAEVMRTYPLVEMQLLRHGRDRSSDELRYEINDAGQLVPVIIGNRTVTLQITLRSRDQRGPTKAFAVLERLRTRLELPAAQAALDALGVVVRESAPTTDHGAVSQQREESVAQLALVLGYAVEERDDGLAEEPIEHVGISGTVHTDDEAITIPEQLYP